MKFKKYRELKKNKISFLKFFYILHKKVQKELKIIRLYYKEFGRFDTVYYNVYSEKKAQKLFKKVKEYNYLNEIFENEEKHYILFSLRKEKRPSLNKKTYWTVSFFDETDTGYYKEGQPYGSCGIEISHIDHRGKNKSLKIILEDWGD